MGRRRWSSCCVSSLTAIWPIVSSKALSFFGCLYEDARVNEDDKCGKLINAIELTNPRCKKCTTPSVMWESKQLFIDLSKFKAKLREWFNFVESGWTRNARVIDKAWLKEGFKSRCITRGFKWSIHVPVRAWKAKFFYVWFDAPIKNMSITSRQGVEAVAAAENRGQRWVVSIHGLAQCALALSAFLLTCSPPHGSASTRFTCSLWTTSILTTRMVITAKA